MSFGKYEDPITRSLQLPHVISQCNDIFTERSIFRYFSREIGQFQSTWGRFGKDKTMRPHENMSISCRHVNISSCLWLQLVTEVPVGIWIRDKFKLKIDRPTKTPWGSCRLLLMGSYKYLLSRYRNRFHSYFLMIDKNNNFWKWRMIIAVNFQFEQLERRRLKNSGLRRDSNSWPLRYQWDAHWAVKPHIGSEASQLSS